jgi:hypothetical protein
MNPAEYEAFVANVQAMTDEQKLVTLRNLSSEMIWQELYGRFQDMEIRDNYYKNAPRT